MGRGVDHSGSICSDAVDDVCTVIGDYKSRYEEMGAERVMTIATSAVRDAVNGEAFIAELRERFGLNARLLTGEEEANLTYKGATAHRPDEGSTLVFDIGGGSTELIVGSGTKVGFHTSLQAGTIRQSERHLTSDPPDPHELEDLADEIRNLIDRAITTDPQAKASRAIAVAGTPTSLAAIDQGLEPYDPGRVHGYRLGMKPIQRMLSRLSCLSARGAAARPRPPPRSRPDDRRRHGDPRPGDARIPDEGDRGLGARHPARLGPFGRNGPRLSRRLDAK